MSHTLQPKLLENFKKRARFTLAETCELHGDPENDVECCSHFDHCERPATIWIYVGDAAWIYGFCNICYSWCYPAPKQWYRVVKISEDFTGTL